MLFSAKNIIRFILFDKQTIIMAAIYEQCINF